MVTFLKVALIHRLFDDSVNSLLPYARESTGIDVKENNF